MKNPIILNLISNAETSLKEKIFINQLVSNHLIKKNRKWFFWSCETCSTSQHLPHVRYQSGTSLSLRSTSKIQTLKPNSNFLNEKSNSTAKLIILTSSNFGTLFYRMTTFLWLWNMHKTAICFTIKTPKWYSQNQKLLNFLHKLFKG